MSEKIQKSVEQWLNEVVYDDDPNYVPSTFALKFVNFIKLVNGGKTENITPVLHYKMLDNVAGGKQDIVNMIFRGSGKTTVMGEYLILYIATYGEIDGFGKIDVGLYLSDTVENGVKNMRKNLEYRYENSEFLKQYVPVAKFTDVRWEFHNIEGKVLVMKGYGACTGIRGSRELGMRPQIAILDDLLSDEDARSPTVISSIEDTIYKALEHALHPEQRKIIWSGTPFNAKDPLYKAVESGAWYVNVFPVCEKFPCERKDFRGAWEDRFNYDYVNSIYEKALKSGKVDAFYQELMLRIISTEDRVIQDSDIRWYKLETVKENKDRFNFYITTDFATSQKKSADYSVISVWAYNNNGDWFWIDGLVKRQLMDANIDWVFKFAQEYKPQQVGIEVTGQQGGFIPWLQDEMIRRNIYFNLASERNSNNPGIRPNTNKMERFNTMVPMFKLGKMYFPEEKKMSNEIKEFIEELSLVCASGMKSKHDDCLDTISMLSSLTPWKPSVEATVSKNSKDDMWEIPMDKAQHYLDNYIV